MLKLIKIIPGARQAICDYKKSKWYEFDGFPKIHNHKIGFRSGNFKSYWLKETKCAFNDHVAQPATRKNHFATCTLCGWFLIDQKRGSGWSPELEKEVHGEVRNYCDKCGQHKRTDVCAFCSIKNGITEVCKICNTQSITDGICTICFWNKVKSETNWTRESGFEP